ncbi:MAG: hypothetical protein P8Y58_08690, partial [Novosphingobium sp.]
LPLTVGLLLSPWFVSITAAVPQDGGEGGLRLFAVPEPDIALPSALAVEAQGAGSGIASPAACHQA